MRVVIAIPFIILLGDALSIIMVLSGCCDYDEYVFYHSQVLGHGILSVAFMLFFIRKFRYCGYAVVSAWTLLSINVLNLAENFLNLTYYFYYVSCIVGCGTVLALIRWKQRY